MEGLTKSYVNTHNPDCPVREDMVMREHFEKAVRDRHVGEVVTLETGERRSSTEILEKADQYAKGLIALGLRPGVDTLAVIGCCSMESLSLFFASTLIGIGYAHPYIFYPKKTSIVNILPDIDARVVVVGEADSGTTFSAFTELFYPCEGKSSSNGYGQSLKSIERVFYDDTWNGRNPTEKFLEPLQKLIRLGESVSDSELQQYKEAVRPEWVMHHIFSSGSTGKPKCLTHTQAAIANEICQLTIPLTSVMALCHNVDEVVTFGLLCTLMSGRISKLVLTCDVVNARPIAEARKICVDGLINEGVEHLCTAGIFTEMLAQELKNRGQELSALKTTLHGAQLVSRKTFERHEKIFGGISCHSYGMSEALLIAMSTFRTDPQSMESRLNGRMFPKSNIELRIVDERGKVADIETEGEIEVRTYSRLKEYKTLKEKTRQLFTADGFLRTGDAGVMYPDGSIIIKGRKVDAMRLKVNGNVVYPGPIEQKMSQHPNVLQISVVCGLENEWIGDEITYCVTLKDKSQLLTEEEIEAICGDELKMPARILYMDSLPYTANSRKVSKALLKEKVKELLTEDRELGKTKRFKKLEDGVTH